jgi:hypothetical protein
MDAGDFGLYTSDSAGEVLEFCSCSLWRKPQRMEYQGSHGKSYNFRDCQLSNLGVIRIDSCDVQQVSLESLRRNIGFVPQV